MSEEKEREEALSVSEEQSGKERQREKEAYSSVR